MGRPTHGYALVGWDRGKRRVIFFRAGDLLSAIAFYDSRAWHRVRREVLRSCNNECQTCKAAKRHSRADIVHHVYHLDEYPQYGLMEYVDDPTTGERKRNLLPVCRTCHETVCHPERMCLTVPAPPLTAERW